MENIEWFYRPSEQRKKNNRFTRFILGLSFHTSGIVYYFVYNNQKNEAVSNSNSFGIILIVVYVIGLLVWWLFLNRFMKISDKFYSISDNTLEIKLANNKTKKYEIDKYESFSENARTYNPQQADSKLLEEKFLYLGKTGSTTPLMLEVNNPDFDRVKVALRQRLKEIS